MVVISQRQLAVIECVCVVEEPVCAHVCERERLAPLYVCLSCVCLLYAQVT